MTQPRDSNVSPGPARRDGHEADTSQFAPKFLQDATHFIARLHQHHDASGIDFLTTYEDLSI
jgi:hypothetical protein